MAGPHLIAVLDQAVVSGTSFLTMVLIARSTDASEVGAYAIAVSLLVSVLTLQNSAVILPYAIQRHRPIGTAAEHAGGALTLSTLLSVATAAGIALLTALLTVRGVQPELTHALLALAAILPLALLREFGRRLAFVELRLKSALFLDMSSTFAQLALLAWLAATGRMSAMGACSALGVATGITGIAWLHRRRHDFVVVPRQVVRAFRQSWNLAKWLSVSQLAVQVQAYVTTWLLAILGGAAVTGVYAACMNIAAFANPLIFGLSNILTPRAVLALKNGGGTGLRRHAVRDAFVMAMVAGTFSVAIVVGGEQLMHIVYRGAEYAAHGRTLSVLSLAILANAVGMPASNALAAMERPRAIVVVTTVAATVTFIAVAVLIPPFGPLGAAYGYLAGNLLGATGRWLAFLMLVPRAGDEDAARRALRRFVGVGDGESWVTTRLGEGDYAFVYAVASRDGVPIAPGHDRLVVKLFRSEEPADRAMACSQMAALSQLGAGIDGRAFGGWTIGVPQPLHLCASPLALIMTAAPGSSLEVSIAAGDAVARDSVQRAAAALGRAMRQSWSEGLSHGDLGLRNVLFDFKAKRVSVIDPGRTSASCPVCGDREQLRDAAALDLGHLLFDLATDVSDLVGNATARDYKFAFVEAFLRTAVAEAASSDQAEQLLSHIRTCAEDHLTLTLDKSWSPRGVWCRFIRSVALRRLDAMLTALESDRCGGRLPAGEAV